MITSFTMRETSLGQPELRHLLNAVSSTRLPLESGVRIHLFIFVI